MDNLAEMGNWTPSYKRGQIYNHLEGAALLCIENCPEDEVATCQGLCAALRRRYEGDVAREKARDALRTIKRRKNETPEDLGTRIQGYTRVGYPESQREEEGVRAFRLAMQDQSLQDQMILMRFDTVEDCVNAVSKVECNRDQVNRQRQAVRLCQVAVESPTPTPSKKEKGSYGGASLAAVAPAPGFAQTPVQMPKQGAEPSQAEKDAIWRTYINNVIHDQQAGCSPHREGGPYKQKEWPSPGRPCHICSSPNHWKVSCPLRNENRGNGRGLDPGSKGQSQA